VCPPMAWWWWQEQGEDVLLEEDVCGAALCGEPLQHSAAADWLGADNEPLVLVATNLRLALMLTPAAEGAQELGQARGGGPGGGAHPRWVDVRGRWDSLCGVWNVVPLGMVMRASKPSRQRVSRCARAPAEHARVLTPAALPGSAERRRVVAGDAEPHAGRRCAVDPHPGASAPALFPARLPGELPVAGQERARARALDARGPRREGRARAQPGVLRPTDGGLVLPVGARGDARAQLDPQPAVFAAAFSALAFAEDLVRNLRHRGVWWGSSQRRRVASSSPLARQTCVCVCVCARERERERASVCVPAAGVRNMEGCRAPAVT
jgi:hypothetical protein